MLVGKGEEGAALKVLQPEAKQSKLNSIRKERIP
jgi:hypothetical protein